MTDLDHATRIEAHRSALANRLAERMDVLDLPGNLSQRERDTSAMVTTVIRQQLAEFESVAAQWAAAPSDTGADPTWLQHLTAWRQTLCEELLTIKSPIRDPEVKLRSDRLVWSIRLIDHGLSIAPKNLPIVDLSPTPIGVFMRAAGYEVQGEGLRGPRGFRGSIREVERRVKLQTAERVALKKMLDRLLISDDERAQMDAESQAQRDALATMNIKNNTTGDGLVAETLYGDPLPVEAMTPEQRSAFERFQAAAFPPRELEPEPETVEQ